MKNQMTSGLSQIPKMNIPRSSFNRSRGHKTTIIQGKLTPFYLDEVLPGDTFVVKSNVFMRMLTPIAPLMDNLRAELFFFYVPNRIIWDNFKKFMGEQKDTSDSTSYTVPTMTCPAGAGVGAPNGSLWDHLGLPTEIASLTVNALPFRAYYRICQDWFKDENLAANITLNTGDGPDTYAGVNTFGGYDQGMYYRGKRKDYFWGALPWPQKGTAASISLNATSAKISHNNSNGQSIGIYSTVNSLTKEMVASTSAVTASATTLADSFGMFADLSAVTAGTIEQLRYAVALQQFMEADARGGTRYTEIVRSHFGVESPDARLQRSEYLGGGSFDVNFHPVAQTSQTSGANALGTLASFSTGSGSNGFVKSFTEHGYIIGIINVTGEYSYSQGIDRMFSRSTKYDFAWPDLSHLGEQAVYNKEIYCDGTTPANNSLVFGYVPRFEEYRTAVSRITGNMRSNATYTYQTWHTGFDFVGLPALNSTYINDILPFDRIVQTPQDDHFLVDAWHDVKTVRALPVQAIPGFMNRF